MPVPGGRSIGDSQLISARSWVDLSSAAGIQDESLFTGDALAVTLGLLKNLALNVVARVRARALAGGLRPGEPDPSTAELVVGALKKYRRVSPDRCPLGDRRPPGQWRPAGDQSASSSAAAYLTRT